MDAEEFEEKNNETEASYRNQEPSTKKYKTG
jgi:hypothetical protein